MKNLCYEIINQHPRNGKLSTSLPFRYNLPCLYLQVANPGLSLPIPIAVEIPIAFIK